MPMAAPISPFSSERRKSWRPARSVSVGVSGRTSRHISCATHQPAVRNRNCKYTGDYCEQKWDICKNTSDFCELIGDIQSRWGRGSMGCVVRADG